MDVVKYLALQIDRFLHEWNNGLKCANNIQKQLTEVFHRKFRKNFAKFTGKHLCWSLFNKVAGLKACFPVNFAKF